MSSASSVKSGPPVGLRAIDLGTLLVGPSRSHRDMIFQVATP